MVSDEIRTEAPEPTIDSFMAKVGEPALTFDVPNDGISIPHGLLSCCRVLHATDCQYHIAGTVLGVAYTLEGTREGEDGETEAWTDERSHQLASEGDLLADPNRLWAYVRGAWVVVQENARQAQATISSLTFAAWPLGYVLWGEWRILDAKRQEQQGERLAALATEGAGSMAAEQLAALPIKMVLDGDDEETDEHQQMALARIMASDRFYPVQTYVERILTMPGEIGHDDAARYVVPTVLTAPATEPMPWLPDKGTAA